MNEELTPIIELLSILDFDDQGNIDFLEKMIRSLMISNYHRGYNDAKTDPTPLPCTCPTSLLED